MQNYMGPFTAHAWLVPAIPLASFFVIALVLRPISTRLAAATATTAVFASFTWAAGLSYEYLLSGRTDGFVASQFEWLRYQDVLSVNAGVLIDPLSLLLMIVVTSISSLVHLYSLAYMADDPGRGRFFTFLNLFTFSMLGLVAAPNVLQMYVCWELVGASSFLLIGFYYSRPAAVSASKKAFIVTRFADLGFLLGVIILGAYGYKFFTAASAIESAAGRPFDFLYLSSAAFLSQFSAAESWCPHVSLLTITALLLFMGAAGKSAMFPLHIWLPDAMEGPTPVSALIHAATMVVAGVYLVARMFALFALSGPALTVILTAGSFTCLFAALIACVQNDLKRVLAYSTLSQLGYMMIGLGTASTDSSLGYSASMFHLFTHAFFKALLFLCAGAVIHAVHTNDIWEMGGLRRKMPVTHLAFLAAALAIAGVYPFAGFFSKDEILAAALSTGHFGAFAVALLVAGLTSFYVFRVYFVCFWGKATSRKSEHAHEAPALMLASLLVLAVLSAVAGFAPVPQLVYFNSAPHHPASARLVAIAGTVVALSGALSAWLMYVKHEALRAAFVSRSGVFYTVLRRKFYIDEAYLFLTHRVIFRFVSRPAAWFDRFIVDGAVNLLGWAVRAMGASFRYIQTGQVQTYGAWIVVGVAVLFVWVM